MTDFEKLKNTLELVFKRRGGNGRYTGIFNDLEPAQTDALTKEAALGPGELPVIGGFEGPLAWLLITTERMIWRSGESLDALPVAEIRHVEPEPHQLISRQKDQWYELAVEDFRGRKRVIAVEPGAPFMGVWNAVLFLARRNRHRS